MTSLPVRGWSVGRGGLSLAVSHYLAGALLLMVVLAVPRLRLAGAAARLEMTVGAPALGPARRSAA